MPARTTLRSMTDPLERRRALARALHEPATSRLAHKLERLREQIERYRELAAALQSRLPTAR